MGSEQRKSFVVDRIAGTITERIADGSYRPNDYLPSERSLAAELDVSRSSVSAALELLSQRGLVLQTQGRGTQVLLPQTSAKTGVGIVLSSGQPNPTVYSGRWEPLLRGITECLPRYGQGYEIVRRSETDASFLLLAEQFAGLIFFETFRCERQILEVAQQSVPLVVANIEVNIEVPATYVDHRQATIRAVETLVGMGHRRIAFVGRNPSLLFYGKARAGYETGLAAAGIAVDESLVRVCEGTDSLAAYFACKPLLALPNPPTAIVAARDWLAGGAYAAITEAGLTVGRDVSVIGFDDHSWVDGREFLTTFREPLYELGWAAAEMLCAQLVKGRNTPEKREIAVPFVLRQSVGPVAGVGGLSAFTRSNAPPAMVPDSPLGGEGASCGKRLRQRQRAASTD